MNWKVIWQKILKGAASGAVGALATVKFTGLTPTGAVISACEIVGAAAFTGAFEVINQMVTGTVSTRIDTDGNSNPSVTPLTSDAAVAKPNYPTAP